MVFLDENDKKMIVNRKGDVVDLSQSGIPLYKRFVFMIRYTQPEVIYLMFLRLEVF